MERDHVKLVCFDIGGVLMRIATGWEDALSRTPIRDRDLSEFASNKQDHEPLLIALETGRIEPEEYYRQAAALFDADTRLIEALLDAWLIEPFEGMVDHIDRLNSRGVATACLSNTSAIHWRIMASEGQRRMPFDRLRWCFASHLVGAMKPDAAIYEHVECETGIDPSRILFFDDYEENVDAARRRGWLAERIVHDEPPTEQVSRHLDALGLL